MELSTTEKYTFEEVEIFSDLDFASLLCQEFNKQGVYRINRTELATKLYQYYEDPKYTLLFQDIAPYDHKIDLSAGFLLLQVGGQMTIPRSDVVKFRWPKDIPAVNDLERTRLMQELVLDYLGLEHCDENEPSVKRSLTPAPTNNR